MNKVKIRALCIRVLTILVHVGYALIVSASVTLTKYDHYAGYRCAPQDALFQTNNVVDALECGKICFNKICVSYAFQPGNYRCIGCKVDIFDGFAAASYEVDPEPIYFSSVSPQVDCDEIIKKKTTKAKSGVYKIKLWHSKSLLDVYCDMETKEVDCQYGTTEGDWMVFQNRFDGSVNFHRNCTDFENGFGSIHGEFWLGLKYIHEITSRSRSNNLLVEMSGQNGEKGNEILTDFNVGKGTNYTIDHFLRYACEPPRITRLPIVMSYDRAPFSCKDRDRDEMATHCAADRHGAWWHKSCSYANLNEKYCTPGQVCKDGTRGKTGFYCNGFAGYESLKTSRLMIKPIV